MSLLFSAADWRTLHWTAFTFAYTAAYASESLNLEFFVLVVNLRVLCVFRFEACAQLVAV